ncbi:MAG TPA: hypothetical protein VGZ73_26165, partial [Bryobacteraceae bacterium]|nr:hypothetical protein [Bryobacteraceae bacterium]
LVIDDKAQRLYTEVLRTNESGDSTGLERLVPIDVSFGSVRALSQRVGTDVTTQGLVNRSYALRLEPSGTAPNYTFMNLLQCLYGEKTQKTVSRNLAQYLVDRLDKSDLTLGVTQNRPVGVTSKPAS